MKKIIIGLLIIGLTMLQANAFEWNSILNFIGRASEMQTTQTTSLKDLEAQMTTIDNTAKSAFVNIVSALSGWKETWSVKSQLKSKESILTEVISNYANSYIANNKQSIIRKIEKMSAKEKTALLGNIATLTNCSQDYVLLAANGARTVSTVLKSAQTISDVTTTISNINNTAAELRQRATTVMTLVSKIKADATTAGVNVN